MRRIVTGHDSAGRAGVASDERVALHPLVDGSGALAPFWATAGVPADAEEEWTGAPPVLGRGSALWIVELAPGRASPPHRTHSIDYGIVLAGSVELELDDGAVTRLAAGDVVIQRGTIHAWRNPSASERCRLAFVLVEAQPVARGGKPLPEVQPPLD